MRPPEWQAFPSGETFDRLYQLAPSSAIEAARVNARALGLMLNEAGVTINCLPMLDVRQPGATDIVGDRALGSEPMQVSALGRAILDGLASAGVLGVIKHIPGHGRAFADSHKDLPVVHASFETLDAWDFAPFKAMSDMPMAMTAHVVYEAVDPKRPATTSKKAVRMIRDHLGFDGLLITDDLSMKALSGSLTDRSEAALKAGCDVVLHCNGDLDEMKAVAKGVGRLKGRAKARAAAALARIVHTPEPLDTVEARARLDAALAGRMDVAKGPDVGEAQAASSAESSTSSASASSSATAR